MCPVQAVTLDGQEIKDVVINEPTQPAPLKTIKLRLEEAGNAFTSLGSDPRFKAGVEKDLSTAITRAYKAGEISSVDVYSSAIK